MADLVCARSLWPGDRIRVVDDDRVWTVHASTPNGHVDGVISLVLVDGHGRQHKTVNVLADQVFERAYQC